MRLSEIDILKLLPNFMKDDEANIALAKAVNKLVAEPGSKYKQQRLWDQIDNLDHKELDELAWEFNVDWYSSALDLQTKREIIKISDQVHKKRGTKWAVEQLISAYFGPGYVQEWFEYDGPPFEFKVLTTNKAVTDEMYQEFVRITQTAKNVRSHLEGIYYYGIYTTPFTYGKTVEPTVFPFVLCGTKPNPAFIGEIRNIEALTRTEIEPVAFDYTRCGTVLAGTTPTAAIIGVINTIDPVTVATNSETQAFEYAPCGTNKAGTTPAPAYVSQVYQAAASVSINSESADFDFVRCGTMRTGEVI